MRSLIPRLFWSLACGAAVLGVSAAAAADPCPPPGAGETALYAAAMALAPGETCELAPDITRAELEAAAGGRPVQWTDSGVWDPIARRIHWVGRDAGCGDTSRPYVHIQYDDAGSTWSLPPAPPIDPCGHGYDQNALDPVTGTFYFRPYGSDVAWAWDGTTWSSTPSVPSGSGPAIGLTYFPELRPEGASEDGALVWAQSDTLYVLARGSSAWAPVPLPTPIGGYHNVSQHDPVHGVMIFGGGNDAMRTVYRMDADGTLTLLGAAPVDLWTHGSEGSYISVDPVGGEFLVDTFGGASDGWWTFDAMADVWTPLVGPPALSGNSFQVPIPLYGVVALFDEVPLEGDGPTLFIYRHRPSELPPLVDGGPGGTDAGSTNDAGDGPRDGAARPTDGAVADGGSAMDDGGCGCRIAGGRRARGSAAALGLVLLLVAAQVWRRRTPPGASDHERAVLPNRSSASTSSLSAFKKSSPSQPSVP